jgi:hypothetical protein
MLPKELSVRLKRAQKCAVTLSLLSAKRPACTARTALGKAYQLSLTIEMSLQPCLVNYGEYEGRSDTEDDPAF